MRLLLYIAAWLLGYEYARLLYSLASFSGEARSVPFPRGWVREWSSYGSVLSGEASGGREREKK